MSDRIELAAEIRTDVGKGASRRLRRDADLVPAVIYGAGKDPVSLSIPHKDLHKACESEAFFSQVIDIKTGSEVTPAIVRDLQRHPAKDRILHADFFRVRMDVEITVEVPLHFVNEETCVGVKQHGGMVAHNITSLEVSCLPGSLPEYLEVDIESLDLGESIHMSELVLPAGVKITALEAEEPQDQIVVSIHERRAEIEPEEEAAGEEAPAAGGEPEDAGESDESSED